MGAPPDVLELLARTVRELRERKKLSQQQLADLAGLERSFINGIENKHHDATVTTLVRLAIALDTTPGEILKKFTKTELRNLTLD